MIENVNTKMRFEDYDAEVTKGIKEYCELLRIKNDTDSVSKRRELEGEAASVKADTDRVIAVWAIVYPKKGQKIRDRVRQLMDTHLPTNTIY